MGVSSGVTVAKYTYSGDGDTLDAAGNVVERTLALPGGVLLTKRATTEVWSHSNLHGDVIATTDSTGTLLGPIRHYDPYGQPLNDQPDNSTGNADNGWLGKHQRLTKHEPGHPSLIEMGARPYNPTLSRFLQIDPIEGGTTTNDYAYVRDPINDFDLDGRAGQGPCTAQMSQASVGQRFRCGGQWRVKQPPPARRGLLTVARTYIARNWRGQIAGFLTGVLVTTTCSAFVIGFTGGAGTAATVACVALGRVSAQALSQYVNRR